MNGGFINCGVSLSNLDIFKMNLEKLLKLISRTIEKLFKGFFHTILIYSLNMINFLRFFFQILIKLVSKIHVKL